MDKIVDYYFTPVSPWTYMGHQRFEDIARRHGAAINYKPVDYGKIFPASGGLPVGKRAPQRQAYRLVELERWRRHLGIPLNLHPAFFPADATLAAKLVIVAPPAQQGRLAGALMRGCWAEDRNLADAATLAAIADGEGLDGKALVAAANTPAAAERYDHLTAEAIQRQVFGAPTYVWKGEPFWGQDRLDFLDRALAAG
jgi:2-hydroxychromene-2-carboxylate isomerase